MKQLYLLLFLQFCFCSSIYAQEQFGSINGIVTDVETGEAIPFANVSVDIGGELMGTTADFDGKYQLDSVRIGVYNFTFSFIGMESQVIRDVHIIENKNAKLNAALGYTKNKGTFIGGVINRILLINPSETRLGITARRTRSGRFDVSNIY